MKTKMNKLKLITHNGSFHADDIFAAATLSLYLEKKGETFEIIRTRDPEIIKSGDFVFDIGYIYNPDLNRFDHHQPGGAGKHKDGIEYSSFGLVWEKFGIELCGSPTSAEIIDEKLALPVDAFDNGFDLVENKYETTPYYIQHLFFAMRPTWKEKDLSKDEMFLKSVEIAKVILTREIIQAQDIILAEDLIVSAYKKSADKKIVILDEKYPFFTLSDFPEPLFVIYPRKITSDWGVEAVRDNYKTFVNRKDFPKSWAGLRDKELQNVSGVKDAVFCHRGLYMAVAKTKEGAIKLAQIAVES
ncbi:MAG: MYG1 family protein [Minisyncoccia bacterium]